MVMHSNMTLATQIHTPVLVSNTIVAEMQQLHVGVGDRAVVVLIRAVPRVVSLAVAQRLLLAALLIMLLTLLARNLASLLATLLASLLAGRLLATVAVVEKTFLVVEILVELPLLLAP
jgi:hypothetical protein